MAMENLKVLPLLKNCSEQFKKRGKSRLHKAQTLCVDKAGADGMPVEPCKLASHKHAHVIDNLARKRKSKKARARAKARAKATASGTVIRDRGDYVFTIQLHS